MIPVGSFSKLCTEVGTGSGVRPLKYHDEYTKSRCVNGKFPLRMRYMLSAVV